MEDFERIYREQFSMVFAYVMTLCSDSHLAEEITQEAFVKALENIAKFKGQSKLSTWLCQIAKNCFLSHCRKKHLSHADFASVTEESLEIDALILNPERNEELHMLVHQLPDPYKEVFSLRVFGELSHKQIGKIFDEDPRWARVVFHRAKNLLKELMI